LIEDHEALGTKSLLSKLDVSGIEGACYVGNHASTTTFVYFVPMTQEMVSPCSGSMLFINDAKTKKKKKFNKRRQLWCLVAFSQVSAKLHPR